MVLARSPWIEWLNEDVVERGRSFKSWEDGEKKRARYSQALGAGDCAVAIGVEL
jgi:hypothetical protein